MVAAVGLRVNLRTVCGPRASKPTTATAWVTYFDQSSEADAASKSCLETVPKAKAATARQVVENANIPEAFSAYGPDAVRLYRTQPGAACNLRVTHTHTVKTDEDR